MESPGRVSRTLRIDLWHDTVCPWCRIGHHNLNTVLDSWDGPPVEVTYHPFLLEPDTPPEGRDLRERLSAKYGVAPEQMFQRVTAAGARYGVSFNWEKVRVGPATAASHVLIGWTPREKQRQVVELIHAAYFDEGRNLGDPSVLTEIARHAGLDGDEARRVVSDPDHVDAIKLRVRSVAGAGISGVPHFRIGDRRISGAQAPEVIREALVVAAG